MDTAKILNVEGIDSPNGKRWLKTSVRRVLGNEVYTGALVWRIRAKDGAPPVRVQDAFPALVSIQDFGRVTNIMHSKSLKTVHP